MAAFFAALAARGISAWFSGPAGPQEVRYITIAQGILAGEGFHGMDKRFPDIIQPPLHMIMLAGSIAVLGNPLLAARTLTVLLGALLVFPVALLAWRIYGPHTAWRAALLAAFYPLLIHYSGIALTEPVFGLLIACTAVLTHQVVARGGGAGSVAGAGMCLGLAFLARPEGLAYMAAVSLFLLVSVALPLRRGWLTAAAWTGLFVGCFLVFTVPYSVWLHARTGHWRISPKAALTQVHNMIMTEGIREHWPEREGTAVFYERVKFGLNEEGTDLRSSEIFRSLGLLPAEGKRTRDVSLLGDVLRPSYLVKVVIRNFRRLYLETLKYGLVLPTVFMSLILVGLAAEPWKAGPPRRSHLLIAWFLMAGCSWALSYVHGRFLYPSVGLVVPWVARGWLKMEGWLADSFPEARAWGGAAGHRMITVLVALFLSLAALVHAIPPVQLTRELWLHHREAGLMLKEHARPGEPVMGLTPIVAFYAGLPFELLPYASLEEAMRYGRLRGARYLVADLEMLRLQRPQLLSLRDPSSAPPGLRHLLTAEGEERKLLVYEFLPG